MMHRRSIHRFRVALRTLVLSALIAGGIESSEAQVTTVVRLDFGAAVDTLDRLAVGLQTRYDSADAIGWTEPPSGLFDRPRLERSRESTLLDGVSGANFVLRADLQPGKWWMTVYLEAGLEDSSTARISANGVGVEPDWQAFD
ncbi:MAG TPA: hypothetical protein VIL33_07965, partial [Rhodothermia bacterium]